MNRKEFKLMCESFNKFLVTEHMGHSQQTDDLLEKVPEAFKRIINGSEEWHCASDYLAEYDADNKDQIVKFFAGVAEELGCSVDEMLVIDHQDGDYAHGPELEYAFEDNVFRINGESLKGYYDDVYYFVAPGKFKEYNYALEGGEDWD